MKKISIIGLGWLGLPLAQKLIEKGYAVKGTTTTPVKAQLLQSKNLDVIVLELNPFPKGIGFHGVFDAHVLIVNIPPKTRTQPSTFHPEQMKYVKALAHQHGIEKVIYVSATSVYPDLGQVAFESAILNPETTGNLALYNAEQVLWGDKDYALTVVRFGGLMGFDRVPGRYFSGKSDVIGDTPVNYIHRDDAVNMLVWILEKQLWNETFNGVSPLHPKRKDIYERNADEFQIVPPKSYLTSPTPYKVIDSEKIMTTGFEFTFPDPLEFKYWKNPKS